MSAMLNINGVWKCCERIKADGMSKCMQAHDVKIMSSCGSQNTTGICCQGPVKEIDMVQLDT